MALGAFARALQGLPGLTRGVQEQLQRAQARVRRESRLSRGRWAGVEQGVAQSTLLQDLRRAERGSRGKF